MWGLTDKNAAYVIYMMAFDAWKEGRLIVNDFCLPNPKIFSSASYSGVYANSNALALAVHI